MWRRPVVAGVLLLAVYVGLSFLNSPRGFLGTDTGGKVATLEVMTRGPGTSLDPDLGYWAEEWDPDGSVHPIYYTAHLGDRWVNVTTLPMLYAALPLYEVGGYRGALLLPMLGAVAAAFAARALARRLCGGRADRGGVRAGWLAYWVVGLASPITIYALDFWEHSWGVALMAWGVVALWDVVAADGRRWWLGAVAGLVFGVSATMRTETLVYFAVAGAVASAVLLSASGREKFHIRSLSRPALAGFAALAVFGAVVIANEAVERAVLDQGIRSARATGVATLAGDAPADRVTEAAYTLVGAVGSTRGVLLGGVGVALLAWGVTRSRTDVRFGVVVIAAAGVVLAVRFVDGLGFVPGLFVAWPLAVVALVCGGWRRWPAVLAVLALPVVLATQFRGGAAPQWAGRYVLTSGLLLAVVGAVVAVGLSAAVRRAVVALAAAVTILGLAWLSVRSHDVERTVATIERDASPVIVSEVAHLAREGGATYTSRRWLTAIDAHLQAEAAEVVAAAGEERILFVELADSSPAEPPDGWSASRPRRVRLFDGVDLRLVTWQRSGSR